MTRDVFVLGRTNRAGRVGTAERKKLFFFFLANNLLRPVTAAAANRTSVRFDLNTSATRPRTAIITCRAPPNLPPPNAFMGTPAPARIRPAGVLLRRNAGCRRVGRSRKRSPPPRRSESSIIPRHRAGGVPLSRRGGGGPRSVADRGCRFAGVSAGDRPPGGRAISSVRRRNNIAHLLRARRSVIHHYVRAYIACSTRGWRAVDVFRISRQSTSVPGA